MDMFAINLHDPADVSVRFASKDIGNNLYESVKLFTIQNDTLHNGIKVHSIYHKDSLYLSIDRSFWIFDNIENATVEYSTTFSGFIDIFHIISNNLVIALSNGEIHMIHLSSKKEYVHCIKTNSCISDESQYFVDIYPEFENSETFLVLTKKGEFYRFKVDVDNNQILSELLIDLHHSITVSSYANGKLLAIGNKYIVYDMYDKYTFAHNCELQFKNLYHCDDYTFLGLQHNGLLCLISSLNLWTQELPFDKMDTFTTYYHTRKSYLYYIAQGTKMVRMVEYNKDKAEIFELDTECFFQLVYSNDEDECQLYLTRQEGEISLHLIRSTEPSVRLQRLIRKTQFKEAEEFAKEYNLNQMDINKAKVSIYLENIACSVEDIDTMIELMASIDDIKFNVDACLAVTCEEVASLQKVLNYVGSLELKEIQDTERVNEIISRFDIYKTLVRCEDIEMTINGWSNFAKCDMLDYLTSAFLNHRMESAVLIFSSLDEENLKSMKLESILEYLDNLSLDSFIAFMYTMIPKSLNSIPNCLNVFIDHIIGKVFRMEKYKQVEYPESAITLVDKMLTILHSQSSIDLVQISRDEQQIESLVNVSKCLETILQIKNNYNFYLPLKDCLDGPSAMLQALLRLNLGCIQEFLIDFMTRNGIDVDEIISQTINELISKTNNNYWAPLVPSVWGCIVSIETRLDLLLCILKAADKPWCPGIREMINVALQFSHPLVKKIQAELEMEPKYIVLYRNEYNLRHESFHSAQKDRFIIQRIIYCNLPTIIEDVHALCITSEDRELGNLLMLKSFIDKGDFNQISKLVKLSVGDEWDVDFLNGYYKAFVVDSPNTSKNFLACLDYMRRNGQNVTSKYSSLLVHKVMQVVPPHLHNDEIFNMLEDPKKRNEVLRLLSKDLSVNMDHFDNLLRKVRVYSNAFNVLPEKVLLIISEYVKDFEFLYKAAEHIYENSTDIEVMCLMATLLLKRSGTNNADLYGTFLNDTVQSDDDGKPLDENLLKKCLSIAKSIAQQAYSLSDHEIKVYRVYKWAMVTGYITRENRELIVSPDYFPLHGNNTNIWTINAFRNVFVMYCNYLNNSKSPSTEYITHKFEFEKEDGEDSFLNEPKMSRTSFSNMVITYLKQNMAAVSRENNQWTICQLLFLLQFELHAWEDSHVAENFSTLIIAYKSSLLKRVFAAKVIDKKFALNLLLSYPIKKSIKIINDVIIIYRSNIDKLKAIVELGLILSTKNKKSNTNMYETTMLAIKWWKAIDNSSFTFKNFCLMSCKNELIVSLIQQNLLSLPQLTEFCTDYKLDKETYYLNYLNNLLATWKPEYEIQVDAQGNRALKLKAQDQKLIEKCMSVVVLINNSDSVLKCINHLWNRTNFYHYEVYIAILTIAYNLNDVRLMHYRAILQFLKSYQRTNKPSSVEIEAWFSRFIHNQPLDNLSEWRYPFSPLLFTADIWKLLRHEINLQNYEKWFILADILKHLHINEICSYVVKDISFISCSKGEIEESGYYLQAKFEHLFKKIDTCLYYITDPLMAASVAFDLIAKIPEGADQVFASKLAFKYAQRYKKSAGIDSDKMCKDIHDMYYHYSSKHILHSFNLATKDYVALLDSPNDLIVALYNDERILSFGNAYAIQCPNINKAADELGTLFQIDMRKMRNSMLDKWMSNTLKNDDDLNQSILFQPEIDNNAIDENVECVQRAAYMCSGEDIDFWRNYLYDCFLENADKYLIQARTLRTLCKISTPEEVAARCDCSYIRALETIEEFFLLNDLHSLGYSMDLERLRAIDKKRLLHKLSKNMSNPLIMKVLMAVCNIYKVSDMDIWEKIISGLIRLNMISELKSCIAKFMQKKIILNNSSHIQAWQMVIDHTFKNFEEYNKPDLQDMINVQIHYIQSSPVLNKLNLRGILLRCIHLKQYEYATLLLQYISEPALTDCINKLLLHRNRNQLINGLKTISGFTGLQYVSNLLQKI